MKSCILGRSNTGQTLLACAVAAGAIAALAVNLPWVWRFTVDDSYITLRYSRHLAEGLGPTFNATGPRAEGYTSFLWMLVLAVPHLLQIPALTAAKVLGAIAALGTTAVIACWARDGARDGSVTSIAMASAVAAYAMLGRTAVHAVSGMETALYTFLLTALLYTSARTIRAPGPARYWRFAVLCTLAGLARPEGNLVAAILFAGAFINAPRRDRGSLVRIAALGWALPLGVYEIWRLSYYGLLFPLPFYVKVASASVLPGAPQVLDWLGDAAVRIGLPVGVAVATSAREHRPTLAAAFALVAFSLLPEHLNGYEYRYLAPLDPMLSVLFGIGIARVLQLLRSEWSRFGVAFALILLACGLAGVDAVRSIRGRLGYADGMASAHEPLGRELAGLGFRGRVALSDAGAIPYLSRWWTLDLVGLNDPEIAITGNRDPSRVLATSPHVIILVSGSLNRFEPVDWNAWEGPLYDAATQRGFACVSIRQFEIGYWLWVLARPDSPEGRVLGAGPGVSAVSAVSVDHHRATHAPGR